MPASVKIRLDKTGIPSKSGEFYRQARFSPFRRTEKVVSTIVRNVVRHTAGQRGSRFVFDCVAGIAGNSSDIISGKLISHAAAHVIPHRRGAVIREFVRPQGLILGPTQEGKPQGPQRITRVDAKTELFF